MPKSSNSSSTSLEQLALQAPTVAERLRACAQIDDPDSLTRIAKAARRRDKTVHRLARDKLGELARIQEEQQQRQQHAQTLCASLEAHAQAPVNDEYRSRTSYLQQQLNSVQQSLTPEQQQRAQTALNCIAGRTPPAPTQPEPEPERTESESDPQPDPEHDTNAWAQRLQQVQSLLGSTAAMVETGKLKPAREKLRQINQMLSALPRNAIAEAQKKCTEVERRFQEMVDWQRKAIVPKLEALCERMEHIAGIPTPLTEPHIQSRADSIRDIQQEWKSLTTNIVGGSNTIWKRFKIAMGAAWQPCQQFYDQLARERARNRRARAALCSELESAPRDSLDRLARIVQSVQQRWARIGPVNREMRTTLDQQFQAAVDMVQTLLKPAYQNWQREKKHLIIRVQRLAQRRSLPKTRELTELRTQWKHIPPVELAHDHELWESFKAACNQVWDRIDIQRQQTKTHKREQMAEGERLCAQVETAAQMPATDLLAQQSHIEHVLQTFSGLDCPPALRKRMASAQAAYASQLTIGLQLASASRLDSLCALAASCAEAELYRLGGGQPDLSKLRATAAELDRKTHKALKRRLQQTEQLLANPENPDLAYQQALQQRHQLVIACEIAAAVDSPPTDIHMRMDIKLQGLSQTMQTASGQTTDPFSAALEWLALGPACDLTNAPKYQHLEGRFRHCLQKLSLCL